MKSKVNKFASFALIIFSFCWNVCPAKDNMRSKLVHIAFVALLIINSGSLVLRAQSSAKVPNTKSPMVYHNGSIVSGTPDIFFIFYGCWDLNCGQNGDPDTANAIEIFASNIGGTPYFQLLSLYPNGYGQAPSGGALYAGAIFDSTYGHGTELSVTDIESIVSEHITNNDLPQDPSAIYVVIASADVGATAAGLCTTVGAPPIHGNTSALGSQARYAFLGNPNRCPAIAGPQFIANNGRQLPTPNNNFAVDVIVSDLARVLINTISDPFRNAWYDKYGLESADKCWGTFGTTYITASGARANFKWGGRDYLVQQNWVNNKKGGCGMQQ